MSFMTAYLEDFTRVHVYIKNSYNNGETKKLFVSTGMDKTELRIMEIEKQIEFTKYTCEYLGQIHFQNEYVVWNDYTAHTPLEFRGIVRTSVFDRMFYYEGNDLGSTYTKKHTTFKVWSPIASQIKVEIKKDGVHTYDLEYIDRGVWTVTVKGDFDACEYNYLIKRNGVWVESIDPYALSSTSNHKESVIIDRNSIKVDLKLEKRKHFKQHIDAIIYEMSVRDFTISESSNSTHRGQFLGVVESNTKTQNGIETGYDYLKSLGVTHVQLLPIYDFGSVDEDRPLDFYNWGYDPIQYNVPEGSYASNINDPYSRIVDLKTMVSKLHEAGLRVNMDVVYNHMYDIATSAFDRLVPYYYFRYDIHNNISNGSFCGNDVASDRLMVRKYIVDSILQWVKEYGIDGFRFDLMGILDITTINQIRRQLDTIDPSIMMYGEGWNMPTFLDNEEKATMNNWYRIPKIGHFNDRFRDTVKGKTGHEEAYRKGFIGGEFKYTLDVIHVLLGSVFDYEKNSRLFGEVHNTVNYIECHDNHTVFDKLTISNSDENEETIRRRAKLGLSIVLLSQGIAFIHAGQEFYRTKNGDHNSYKSSDMINQIDWLRRDLYEEDVEYFKQLIALRKQLKPLHMDRAELINAHARIKMIEFGIIQYDLKNVEEFCEYKDIKILINATKEEKIIDISHRYDVFVFDQQASITPIEEARAYAKVAPISITLLMRK